MDFSGLAIYKNIIGDNAVWLSQKIYVSENVL
jgi:hypothetical protein